MKKTSLINSLPAVAKVLGDKMKVRVRVSGSGAYTDGDLINIPVLPDNSTALTLARGFIDHEAGHVRFTDFSVERKTPLEGFLSNIIEDVRIERMMGETFPGCKVNLKNLATLLQSNGDFSLPEEGVIRPSQAFSLWMLAILRVSILGHDALQPAADDALEVLNEIFPENILNDLSDLAIEGGMAQSTNDALAIARQIIKVLEGWEEEERKKQEKQQKSSSEQQSSDPQSQAGSGSEQQQGSSQPSSGTGSVEDQGVGNPEKQDAESTAGSEAGSSTADAVAQILSASDDELVNGDCGEMIRSHLEELSDQTSTHDETRITFPSEKKAPSNSLVDVSAVRKTTAAMRGRLAGLIQASRYRPTYTGKHGRRVDSGALSRLASKDHRVFRKSAERAEVNTAITVLVDRSGSMGMSSNNFMDVANQASLATALALDTIPCVKVETAAFPGTTNDEVLVMTSFEESVRSSTKFYGINACGGTPTDKALNWAAIKLSLRPEPRKMCLLITDGQPNNPALAGSAAKRLRDNGIEVMGIGICCDYIKTFIPNSRVINNVSELPQAMFGILQSEMTK